MCKKVNRECFGCGDCQPDNYVCPVCGDEPTDSVFVDNNGNVVGCSECCHIKEPWEMLDDE